MALEIFKLVGSIFVDNTAANDSLAKTDEKASNVGQTLLKGAGTAAKWGTAIVGGTAAAATAMVGFASNSAAAADEVDKMSQKIGLSKQGYQEWSYVMGQNGMEIDKLQTGMKTLVEQMDSAASGTESAQENFNKLVISIYDSSGKLKDQETIMQETLYALADMENGTEKARLATELFGKSGSEMMPMLNQGSGAMQDLTDRAHELGLIMSDEAVNSGVQLGDLMDDVKDSVGMLATNLGTSLFPILIQICETIIANLPMIQGMFDSLAPTITGLLEGILPPLIQLGSTLIPILIEMINQLLPFIVQIAQQILPVIVNLVSSILPPLMQLISSLLPPLMQIITALMPILTTVINLLTPILNLVISILQPVINLITSAITPIITVLAELINTILEPLQPIIEAVAGLLTGVLGSAFEALSPIINSITGIFKGLIDFITGIFSGDWKKAWDGVVGIFSGIFEGIGNIIKAPINFMIGCINGIFAAISKIKIPDWVPLIGGAGFNLPQIPLLAKGGNVEESGKAIINEAGAELVDLPAGARVTPLTKGGGSNIEALFTEMVNLLRTLVDNFPELVREGVDGTSVDWNERELARLIKTYEG